MNSHPSFAYHVCRVINYIVDNFRALPLVIEFSRYASMKEINVGGYSARFVSLFANDRINYRFSIISFESKSNWASVCA